MASENLSDFELPITDGKIYIRVINTSTGEITRNEIDIDVSTDTLSSIASDISSITGLTASVVSSKLQITADSNYEFDFLGAVLPEPVSSTLTGGSLPTISVSGIYTGTSSDTFRFTVSGAGSVGNGTLQLEVRDSGGAGDVIATLNIGAGYAAGDELDVGNGIKISLSAGDFGAGDNFDVDAFASTDTSGFLSAVGLNTFFSGSSASDISVCSDIVASPGRLAAALGGDMTDNANALRLCGLRDEALSSLDSLTPGEFYRRLVTNLGQEVSVKQMRQESIMAVVQSLSDQQSEISGVDINNEAANLLLFEQMFQAMAKYINTVQASISTIMEML
jgi:flagellar hook-associated protein 1 FlgK